MVLFLPVASFGQYHSPADSATEGTVYTSFFFRFRYSFTASWVPQTGDMAEQVPNVGQARLSDEGNPGKAGKSYYLLTLFRTLPGQGIAGRSRAFISVVAEDVSSNPQITNGKDCVLKLAEHMKKARFAAVGEPKEMHVNGRTFFRQDMKGTSSAGAPVYQSAIFTTTGGYALGFLLISPNPSLLANMAGTVNTIQFY